MLITLYMGPVALALYVMAAKEPRPGEHKEFIRPLWKQGVGSTAEALTVGYSLAFLVSAALLAVAAIAATALPEPTEKVAKSKDVDTKRDER